ncbi:MAG TPA: AAA family ATPase, partial [Candidatus Paceibacterota bacterium]|nr:AAA family ATPase [Candidatus Paceibacterota bacterium]
LTDLIHLCDKYPLADNIEYNINMKSLHNIKPSLIELQNMIGMNSIKENIVDQIIYFIQDLHNISPNNSDYLHAVIYGPPGTGKTEVAKIMGKIFSNLGILKNNVFKKVTRDDLVAGYLGQTAIKTKDVIKECVGGVLFIDEAYALGNKEKRDSFSKECIDTICEALSDHKQDLMCIIAGYEQEIKDCFFSYNSGLESRFTWKFTIDDYDHKELKLIFEKKIRDCGWKLKEPLKEDWFEKNKDYFKYFGRDMETLFSKVKIAHSRRVFCLPKEEKTKISMKDLDKGFTIYKQMGESGKRKDEADRLKQLHYSIYC